MSDPVFSPPINRDMRILDRSFFKKRVSLAAARINNSRDIAKVRTQLEKAKDALQLERCMAVRPVPGASSQRCILLKPEIRPDDRTTWGSSVEQLADNNQVEVIPYELHLDYGYWTYHDIVSCVLPQGGDDEIPSGFTQVGHVAHLNLREQYVPYKRLIGEVLIDKNPKVRTVINKLGDVGEENPYRTFRYEVLAGEDNMDVEVNEEDCTFKFNFARVYWNTRLNTEHRRLVDQFKAGEAVCDAMAGVGPFALPAAKRNIFVWANDLNPDSYSSLVDNISGNKVAQFVKPFNLDGRLFIYRAAQELLSLPYYPEVRIQPKTPKSSTANSVPAMAAKAAVKTFRHPDFFSHYIMNLPDSALTFLPSFIGIYAGKEALFDPKTGRSLPLIHVYCFSRETEDGRTHEERLCEELSKQLGCQMRLDDSALEMNIHDVRNVAPSKTMFCVSFRLPKEVAFRREIDGRLSNLLNDTRN